MSGAVLFYDKWKFSPPLKLSKEEFESFKILLTENDRANIAPNTLPILLNSIKIRFWFGVIFLLVVISLYFIFGEQIFDSRNNYSSFDNVMQWVFGILCLTWFVGVYSLLATLGSYNFYVGKRDDFYGRLKRIIIESKTYDDYLNTEMMD